uniref:zinc finger protein 638-like n=1 Tax=Agelaius phoeniceus TaxID=39638 RepID=UPI0023ED48D1|nr:zinc finger protein 638-like [Agelaius phoeniceus]
MAGGGGGGPAGPLSAGGGGTVAALRGPGAASGGGRTPSEREPGCAPPEPAHAPLQAAEATAGRKIPAGRRRCPPFLPPALQGPRRAAPPAGVGGSAAALWAERGTAARRRRQAALLGVARGGVCLTFSKGRKNGGPRRCVYADCLHGTPMAARPRRPFLWRFNFDDGIPVRLQGSASREIVSRARGALGAGPGRGAVSTRVTSFGGTLPAVRPCTRQGVLCPQCAHADGKGRCACSAPMKTAGGAVDAASLRSHLVHLGNLPAQGYRELELVCAGLRFGKVEHYAVLSNRRRAILHLDSPKSARSMHSFLQQYPYSIGEHTLTCSLSSHGDIPEAETGKKEVKREDGSKGSSGLKKIPEGSGTVQKPAGNPSGEARKGQIPTPNVPEEIPAGQLEIPESQAGGAAVRESPAGMDVEGSDPGIPVDPAGSKSPGARSEEKPAPLPGAGTDKSQDEPELEIHKEDEEPSAPASEPLESSSKAIPAAGGTPGAVPGMSPSSEEAPAVSPGVTQPSTEPPAPEKTPVPEAGKSSQETSTERKAVPKTPDAPGKKLDVAGAEREATAEESVLKIGENPGKSGGKAGTELEKTPGKTSSKGGENSGNAVGEMHGGSSVKIPQSKGMGAAKSEENRAAAPVNPTVSLKESCIGKTLLKAVVSVPDILKQKIPIRITEPSLGRAGEQKIPPKAGLEKKIPPKTAAQPGAGNSQWKGNGNSGVDAQGDGGKSSSQQEKDSQLESRASSKQSQPGESGTSGTKENPGGNQAPGGGGAAAWKSGTGSTGKQKEEEELFPFNLDEFVTVDEVLEEAESPVMPRRNPPRGKRKEAPKANPSEPAPKKRKGKSCGAEVDEVGDEEEENTFPGKNPPEDEDDEDIVAVAGPEEMGILGDTNPEDEMAEISKPKAQLGSEDAEPKSQPKKTTFPGVPKTQSTPKALDILVPKAGFFCQICSLFYADEPSMINHCRTPLHRQNMEKFMAKQQESGGEEPSSR